MYYGSEFTYFLDELPYLADDAASWAYISADTPIEDESLYEFELDFDRDFNLGPEPGLFTNASLFDPGYTIASNPGSQVQLDREEEPPTSDSARRATRYESANEEGIVRGISPESRRGVPPVLKALQNVVPLLFEYDPTSVAEEITRLETQLFLKITVGIVLVCFWFGRTTCSLFPL